MRHTDWQTIASGFRPAIPAFDRLKIGDGAGNIPSHSLQTGLAAVTYRMKNGLPAWLTVPLKDRFYLKPILHYLHACRIDALHGFIRASWLNSHRMALSPDLLVWTRASKQMQLLRTDKSLRARHIGLNRDSSSLKGRIDDTETIVRTLICQPSEDMMGFVDELAGLAHPFFILMDMTPFGYREHPRHVIELMESYFKDCPLLILTASGDLEAGEWLRELPGRYVHWHQHPRDAVITGRRPELDLWKARLITLPDNRLENRLIEALALCREIGCETRNGTEVLKPLYRVIRSLRTLAIPYTFYDSMLNARRRGGLYPIRPLQDWLDSATRTKMDTGLAQSKLASAVTLLKETLKFVSDGKTGKSQALKKWIDNLLCSDQRGLIVVSGQLEAEILRSWITRQYVKVVDDDQLVVAGVSSIRELYSRMGGEFDQVLATGALRASDWWCAFTAKQATFLSYSGESHWMEKSLAALSSEGMADTMGKAAWWTWEPPGVSEDKTDTSLLDLETWGECSGEYTESQTVALKIDCDPNWLQVLFGELPDVHEAIDHGERPSTGDVVITTEMTRYRFDMHETVHVVTEAQGQKKVSVITAQDVQAGMRLLLLYGDDQRETSLLEELIGFFRKESTQEQVTERLSQRWFDYLDGALGKTGSSAQLLAELKRRDVDCQLPTLERWRNRQIIAPNNKEIIVPALAGLSGIKHNANDLTTVIKAMTHVLGLHVKIGKLLQQALLAEIEGATEVSVSGKMISLEELRSRYGIEVVYSVYRHDETVHTSAQAKDLAEVLKAVVSESNGKLSATNKAYKSAKKSGYEDLSRAKTLLRLLAREYYAVFAHGASLDVAIKQGLQHGIEYRGNTSDTTKGQFKSVYLRPYKGKNVDIGKHLNLGSSRNPERCLRVHFHYDKQDQQLVIHHIGRHLPTNQE